MLATWCVFPINGRVGGDGGREKAAIDDFFFLGFRVWIKMNEMERVKAIERSHEGKVVGVSICTCNMVLCD